MRLCTFFHNDVSYGLVKGEGAEAGVVDLRRHVPEQTLRAFLAAGGVDRAARFVGSDADYRLGDCQLLPPIPDPDKIICVGMNYPVSKSLASGLEHPVIFARFAGSQVGHGEALVIPLESEQFDFEGELAVVIGRAGRRIPETEALTHVAGYSCYNDATLRDWQKHSGQFLPGKNFAGTGAFGPFLVTADEVPDPLALLIETRLNGEVVQRGSVGEMIFSISRVISYCSTFVPLLPGDVFVSGTPGRFGATRTPPLWMRDGDVCTVSIEGVGCLANPVRAESKRRA